MLKEKKQFVIGSGFIAKKFKKYIKFIKKNNVIVYAAGISNSLERNKKNLSKEIKKLKKFLDNNRKKIIYISTYSVNDNSRISKPYVKNKIKIEKIIQKISKEYLIIRLPEIIGRNKNPKTLTNFFFNNIIANKEFIVHKNVQRNLLDIDDAIKKCIKIIIINKNKNKKINILNKNFYTPLQIVENFEKILSKKALYSFSIIKKNKLILKNNYFVNSSKNYLFKTLRRHYF